jgi:hypothetical protein
MAADDTRHPPLPHYESPSAHPASRARRQGGSRLLASSTEPELREGQLDALERRQTHRELVRAGGVKQPLAIHQTKDLQSPDLRVRVDMPEPLDPGTRVDLLLAHDDVPGVGRGQNLARPIGLGRERRVQIQDGQSGTTPAGEVRNDLLGPWQLDAGLDEDSPATTTGPLTVEGSQVPQKVSNGPGMPWPGAGLHDEFAIDDLALEVIGQGTELGPEVCLRRPGLVRGAHERESTSAWRARGRPSSGNSDTD